MIEVRNLAKRFGDITALAGVSFDVNAGETMVLLGPNGSGKTTALKCLCGLTVPSAGHIRIGGMDLLSDPVACRVKISYLPQHVFFSEQLTAREVLDFYRRLRHLPAARVDAVLDQCLLRKDADRMANEFSGGMMQRLGIAVPILADAPVLLLDEPTASLDLEAAAAFRAFLASLKELGKTIVFSSHMLSDADMLADRVAILVGGRLRVVETIASLRNDLNARSLLQIQLRNSSKRFCAVAAAAGASGIQCSTDGLKMSALPASATEFCVPLKRPGRRSRASPLANHLSRIST